jgi:hypothetical protein
MSHKLTCVVTGKSIIVGNEYFQKKLLQFGSQDILNELYVSRQVKSLLKRGYKIQEVRDLLKINSDDKGLKPSSDIDLKKILKIDDESSETDNIKKSDPDVIEYIKKLKSTDI